MPDKIGNKTNGLADAIVKILDSASANTINKAEPQKSLAEILACTGRCDGCLSRLVNILQEAGYMNDGGTERRKWLYPDYPAVALPGLYCLRYDNGYWYLRSEDPKWLHNPFKGEDGYWYEEAPRYY
ncbi:MAG: hypothetical protein PHY28_09855 [Dehalococcoidales bacterium]|nr:hypothetical protein [Dehalococcoidales bacterium]